MPAYVAIQDDVLRWPKGSELHLKTNCNGIVKVVWVAETIPNEEEFVGARTIGIEELFVGCDWGTCGHCEV